MIRYILVSIISGFLFGTMDGLINANPIAIKLLEVFKPLARTSINVPAGIIIDLVYGFILAGIFLILYKSLPGNSGIIKGLSFGIIIWFFRVVMYVLSSWMQFNVTLTALLYILITGLIEMLILGLIYGLTLKIN